jgi:hypothetical protein
MKDEQQDQSQPHLLQSLILICLETFLTFVLKNDRSARQHAKAFFLNHSSLLFNVYLPSMQFYVSFDQRGVFFDLVRPEGLPQADMVVSASVFDLLKILFTGHRKTIRGVHLKGQEHLHKDFRLLLGSINLPALLADWRYWLNAADEKTRPSRHSLQSLSQHIEQQRNEITQLQIKVKSYRYDLKRLQRQYKLLRFAAGSIILLLLICLAAIICYY